MHQMMYAFQQTLNDWGRRGQPGLFLTDFELTQPRCYPLDEIDPAELCYDFQGVTNAPPTHYPQPVRLLDRRPSSPELYRHAFEQVQAGLLRGDSFLTNLTMPTAIDLSGNLSQVFHQSKARYKLWLRDQFVCFSPEIFVQIQDGRICAYPMKGTRPAWLAGEDEQLLADPKEKAEHATIVDLIRNDLSQVAQEVRVESYRYLERVPTARGGIWQTSSCIAGRLAAGYPEHLGDLLLKLLPAGSVSGAPKHKTLEIIRQAEGRPRGFYTGVAGLFDGRQLDSFVMIRFIEQQAGGYQYWSGGGITAQSKWQDEYNEVLEKVYLST